MEDPLTSSSNLAFSLGMGARKTALELALRNGEKTAASTTAASDSNGHEQLLRWLQEQGAGSEKTGVCMEASGDFEKVIVQRFYEEGYRAGARVRGESRVMRRVSFHLRRPMLPTDL
jgi:hypothetical protein